uniref:Uncharacterized protein n=1 Tax=Romanomermis culicivorax TaxID=13658 RepID=A0A915K7P1_ROMCU
MTMMKMTNTKVIHRTVQMKKKFTNQFKLVVGVFTVLINI